MTETDKVERNKQACKRYYSENREHCQQYQREYTKAHKEELRAKAAFQRMGLIPRRPCRGRPRKGEPSAAELMAQIGHERYAERLRQKEEERKVKLEQMRIQRAKELLESLGYTIEDDAKNDVKDDVKE